MSEGFGTFRRQVTIVAKNKFAYKNITWITANE